ncbi:2-oxo acid dehydrogenase subunit E2 [Haloarcula sp. JP-L23]|uniref:2-oxo acid dehydrogenase subunit E2 n=1 Tax=Haloarcula sp. JP-L23 TaxID=2716717 RepID=UPI00140F1A7E|nr:2-oxo acid dehydrogenase subunit E2 [Haloarcula sp. JP-L23]
MTDDESAERTVREERALSPMRKTIASRLQESYREAVHVTVNRSVDAEGLLSAVAAADPTEDGVSPSMVDVLLCALSDTLDEHPAFNATFEDEAHVLYEEHNVGVAVAIDDGLVTPVVADVGSKSLGELASERRELTERVVDGDYTMSTFRGGTFTVSNLGPLGVDSFDPIINPPEIAILGVGRITERATQNGDGDVVFRRQMPLDLSFDHRVVDGADAARFLGTLAEHLDAAEKYV